MKLTITKMSKMIGRSRDLLGDWKKNYPALFEIVQIGCETKLKQEQCQTSETTQTIAPQCGTHTILVSNEASIKAGEILVREFAKAQDIVEIVEKQFYQWMREQKIISESNEPYQKYVTSGYFTYKPTEERHGGKFRYTLRITPRGKVWLAAKYMAYLDSVAFD